jgi:FO synthase subunit 2
MPRLPLKHPDPPRARPRPSAGDRDRFGCAFRRDPGEPGHFRLALEDLQYRACQAQRQGATGRCLQGGLNSAARLDGSQLASAEQLLRALDQAAPGIHLHAFSPQELVFIAEQDGIPLAAVLEPLRAAQLSLGPWIAAHQPSWVKLTLAGANEALPWGCNDLGGTLMEEHITTMAGARGGTSQNPADLQAAAASVGRAARQRTTLYGPLP